MYFLRVELAPFAGAYYFLRIENGCRPIKTLAERVSNQGPRGGVMATNSCMDIFQQPPPLFDRDATLEDVRVPLLIELTAVDGE